MPYLSQEQADEIQHEMTDLFEQLEEIPVLKAEIKALKLRVVQLMADSLTVS